MGEVRGEWSRAWRPRRFAFSTSRTGRSYGRSFDRRAAPRRRSQRWEFGERQVETATARGMPPRNVASRGRRQTMAGTRSPGCRDPMRPGSRPASFRRPRVQHEQVGGSISCPGAGQPVGDDAQRRDAPVPSAEHAGATAVSTSSRRAEARRTRRPLGGPEGGTSGTTTGDARSASRKGVTRQSARDRSLVIHGRLSANLSWAACYPRFPAIFFSLTLSGQGYALRSSAFRRPSVSTAGHIPRGRSSPPSEPEMHGTVHHRRARRRQ